MILLRRISYIVWFKDMFRLQLWGIFRLITFLSEIKYTISSAIVIVNYEISRNIKNFNIDSTAQRHWN